MVLKIFTSMKYKLLTRRLALFSIILAAVSFSLTINNPVKYSNSTNASALLITTAATPREIQQTTTAFFLCMANLVGNIASVVASCPWMPLVARPIDYVVCGIALLAATITVPAAIITALQNAALLSDRLAETRGSPDFRSEIRSQFRHGMQRFRDGLSDNGYNSTLTNSTDSSHEMMLVIPGLISFKINAVLDEDGEVTVNTTAQRTSGAASEDVQVSEYNKDIDVVSAGSTKSINSVVQFNFASLRNEKLFSFDIFVSTAMKSAYKKLKRLSKSRRIKSKIVNITNNKKIGKHFITHRLSILL